MKVLSLIICVSILFEFPQEKSSVELYEIETEEGIEIHVRNQNYYSVTLEVDFDLENLVAGRAIPFTEILPPKSDQKLTDLKVRNKDESWGFQTSYGFHMGDIFAQHNNSYIYRLPYRLGTEHRVGQSYNGSFSHTGSVAYSIDFDMPEGTGIYSARSGVVVAVQELFKEGGETEYFKDKANYITVVHNDGTFSEYSHLRYDGAIVTEGQRIRTGQLIGYSGSTGYATGPHLHFNVKKAVKGGEFITIPVEFVTRKGAQTLKEKKSYKAL